MKKMKTIIYPLSINFDKFPAKVLNKCFAGTREARKWKRKRAQNRKSEGPPTNNL